MICPARKIMDRPTMTAFPPPPEDPEYDEHSPAEGATAACSTWVSVGVNVVPATTQITIGNTDRLGCPPAHAR